MMAVAAEVEGSINSLDQPSKDSKAIDVWISTSVEEPSLPFCSVWKIRGRPGHTCFFEQRLKCLV